MTENWRITGEVQLEQLIEEVRMWDGIDLVFHVRENVAESTRYLEDDAGKYEIIEMADGGFEAVDRAGGENTHNIEAPTERQELREVETWHVSDYELRPLDQKALDYELRLNLVAEGNVDPRDVDYDPGQDGDGLGEGGLGEEGLGGDADVWRFNLFAADILTHRVSFESPAGGSSVGSRQLTAIFDVDEQLVFERSATQQASAFVREVFDGEDVAIDTSSDSVNTVDITPPEGSASAFEKGTYIIIDWEAEWLNDDWYQTTMNLLKEAE